MSDKYPGGFVTAGAPAGYSVYTNGSGSGPYIRFGSSAALTFGTGDFTVEFWVYFLAINDSTISYLYDMRNANGTGSFFVEEPGNTWTYRDGAGNLVTTGMTSSTFTANQWYHVAVCRASGVINFYINGTKVSSNPADTSNYATSYISIMSRHVDDGGANNTNAYTSNFRIVKGTAVYTANFTPPTQLFAITNTSLLTCQNPAIVDNSTNALTPTIATTNVPTVSNFTPFAGYTGFNPALGAAAGGVWTLDEAAYYQNNRQWPIYDPYFNQTTLMLHGNGTNGAQNNTFLDSSTNNFTITRNGNTTQGSFSPFSQTGWSTYFSGAQTTPSLSFPNNAAYSLGSTSDFTVEAFVYFTNGIGSSSEVSLVERFDGTSGPGWIFGKNSSDNFWVGFGGSTYAGSTTLSANRWYHLCWMRTGGSSYIFVNGVLNRAPITTANFSDGSSPLCLGERDGIQTFPFTGYMANVRIVKGTAVYPTGGFTVPTSPLTAVTNTSLLTCQDNRFVDDSAINATPTVGAASSVQAFSPFVPAYITPTTYSGFFGATTGKLSIASMTALGSDFTIECWINPSSFADYNTIWDNRTSDTDASGCVLGLTSAKKVYFYTNASFQLTTTTALTANTWTHLALVRSGSGSGNVKIYINGVADATTATYTTSFTRTAASIACDWNTRSGLQFFGAISNFRTLTTALYTANFTPPTAPSTAVANTTLLTCQSSTFIDNSGNSVAITVSGTAYPVTSPTPFNPNIDTTTLNSAYSTSLIGGSAYFDGSGDVLVTPASANLAMGTGAFTVECWFYANGNGSDALISAIDSGSGNYSPAIYFSGATTLKASIQSGVAAAFDSGNISFALYSWNHVALVRDGSGNCAAFLNGTRRATGTTSQNITQNLFNIGRTYVNTGSGTYVGYISGTRIVKGTAIYDPLQTGFAPPVAPPTPVANTQLLLNYTNGTIFDNTAKNVFETVGNAQISTTQSKYGGSSMYFGATNGNYLTTYDPAYKNSVGSGDWTFECWVYANALPSSSSVPVAFYHLKNDAALATTVFIIELSNTGAVSLSTGSSLIAAGTAGKITTGSWIHFACVRSNGTIKTYFNGVSDISVANTTTYNGTYVQIGAWRYSGYDFSLNGYIDDLRITKYARYVANFTPPTSQLQDQ